MRTIMVFNPKGGSGKTTLATNLASYYANQGQSVLMVDYDPQESSLEWIDARDTKSKLIPIYGMSGVEEKVRKFRDTDVMIMDAPAAVHGKDMRELLKLVETLIIPVIPSPIDMRAAAHFIEAILSERRVSQKKLRLALVANRVKERSKAYHSLELFLGKVRIPFVTHLRDAQVYLRAAETGAGIFDLSPHSVVRDLEEWEPLIKWLRGKRSRPLA